MNLVGVLGDPVDENPSYIMQEAAFKAASLHWRYCGLARELIGMLSPPCFLVCVTRQVLRMCHDEADKRKTLTRLHQCASGCIGRQGGPVIRRAWRIRIVEQVRPRRIAGNAVGDLFKFEVD